MLCKTHKIENASKYTSDVTNLIYERTNAQTRARTQKDADARARANAFTRSHEHANMHARRT